MDQIHAECKGCLDKQHMQPKPGATHYSGTCTRCNKPGPVYDVRDTEYICHVPKQPRPVDGGMVVACIMILASLFAFLGIILLCAGCSTTDQARIAKEIERAKEQINGKDAPDVPATPLPPPPVVDPPPPAEPPPAQPGAVTHIVKRITKWYGPNLSNAVVDDRFVLEVRNNGRDWSPAPSDWPSGRAGAGCPGDCNVMVCAAYQRPDGSWVGGKYDWNRPKPSPRDWANVQAGYNGWQAPPAGTMMIVWCYTADGNRVSREATTTYK